LSSPVWSRPNGAGFKRAGRIDEPGGFESRSIGLLELRQESDDCGQTMTAYGLKSRVPQLHFEIIYLYLRRVIKNRKH
jgi:hypothetical protein